MAVRILRANGCTGGVACWSSWGSRSMLAEAACLALQPEHPTSSPLPRLSSPPAEPVRSRKPPPLVEAKASVATFDAAQQPLSCYVLQGRDYRADTLQVGMPALRLAVEG